MLYILPNVHQLTQITSLYNISGDPIIHNIAKIATIVLKMGCPKQIKLLQKGIVCTCLWPLSTPYAQKLKTVYIFLHFIQHMEASF